MGKYNIITIERQFGSGGREVGRIVAETLGIPFYNEEILNQAAKTLNISPSDARYVEESVTKSLLYAIAIAANPAVYSSDVQLADRLFYEESEIIKRWAQNQNCVIVGRCAGWVLQERNDCLNVFIYADEEMRRKRVIEQYGVAEKSAPSAIHKADKRRSEFYNAHAKKRWDDMRTYDMCLDSGTLGEEGCAQLIVKAVARA